MFARPAALTDRWHRLIRTRLRIYKLEINGVRVCVCVGGGKQQFKEPYLSATRTELSSCPVVMIPSRRIDQKKNKKN